VESGRIIALLSGIDVCSSSSRRLRLFGFRLADDNVLSRATPQQGRWQILDVQRQSIHVHTAQQEHYSIFRRHPQRHLASRRSLWAFSVCFQASTTYPSRPPSPPNDGHTILSALFCHDWPFLCYCTPRFPVEDENQ
jgi:hypothetical protein